MYKITANNEIEINQVVYRYVNDIDVTQETANSRKALAVILDETISAKELVEFKADAILAVRQDFSNKFNEAMSKYTSYEVNNAFSIQYNEYSAWKANNTALTPYVDAILAVRIGTTKTDFFTKLELKLVQLGTMHGELMVAEDAINACIIMDEVQKLMETKV